MHKIQSIQKKRISDTCEIDPSLHLALDQLESLQKIKVHNLKKITGGEILYNQNFLNEISPVEQLGRYKNFIGASSNVANYIKSLRKPIRRKFIQEDSVKNLGMEKDVYKLQQEIQTKLSKISQINYKNNTLSPVEDFLLSKNRKLSIHLTDNLSQNSQRLQDQSSINPNSISEFQSYVNNGNLIRNQKKLEKIPENPQVRIHSKNFDFINGFLKPHHLSKKLRSISLTRGQKQSNQQNLEEKDKILTYLPLQLIANTQRVKRDFQDKLIMKEEIVIQNQLEDQNE